MFGPLALDEPGEVLPVDAGDAFQTFLCRARHVGCDEDIRGAEDWAVRIGWLAFENVERRARKFSGMEREREGFSSTRGPRAQLIKKAPFFIFRMVSRLMR